MPLYRPLLLPFLTWFFPFFDSEGCTFHEVDFSITCPKHKVRKWRGVGDTHTHTHTRTRSTCTKWKHKKCQKTFNQASFPIPHYHLTTTESLATILLNANKTMYESRNSLSSTHTQLGPWPNNGHSFPFQVGASGANSK